MKGTKLILVALLLLAVLYAAGCGGGGGSSSGGNGGGTQAQNFDEAVTLPTGQAGALSLAVQTAGTASGALAVAGTGTAATASLRSRIAAKPHALAPLAPGVYAVTGTLTNGTFTLTGTAASTAFTLTGSVPAGSTAGGFTLTLGTGTGATVYTGTLATAPSGTSANSAIAGSYQLTALGNPATGQTQPCPGTLAFGSDNSDNCTASEMFTLTPSGSYTVTGLGEVEAGSYSLIGNIMTITGPTHSGGKNGPTATYVYSAVTSGNTLTLTLLSTTDTTSQTQTGEVLTLTKANSTATIATYAGTYAFTATLTGPSGTSNNKGTFSISPTGVFTILQNSSGYLGSGTATLNSSGQIVVVHSFTSNNVVDVETDIATISGSPGSYIGTGTYSITTGGTGTNTFTEISTPTANPFAGNYVGNAVEVGTDGSHGVSLLTMTVAASGAVSGSFNSILLPNGAFGGTIPFTGTVSTAGVLNLSDVSGGVPETSNGTLTAGANHTLTTTQVAIQSDASPTLTSYLTLGMAATTAAVTGTHSLAITSTDGKLSVNGSITIASNGTLTDMVTVSDGSSATGSGYLDANNNLFFTNSAPAGGTPSIFVGTLQPASSGFTVTGTDYTAADQLSQATAFTGTFN